MDRRNLDHIVEVLEEHRFDESTIFGIVFFLACRLSFCRDEDGKQEDEDSQEFITKRYNTFFNLDNISELNSRHPRELIDPVVYDAVKCFQTFAFYLNLNNEDNRMDINGRPTQVFNPHKYFDYLKQNVDYYEYKLFHINEIYSNFFLSIGDVLRQMINSYKEAFAFADIFINHAGWSDQVGFSRIVNDALNRMPPIYMPVFDLFFHQGIYDEKGILKERNASFQLTLQGFMHGLPVDQGQAVWNLQRLLMYNQDTGERINTEFQFLEIRQSEKLFNAFLEKVIEPNQEYLISIKPYFDNEYTLLSSYQNSGSETTFEFLYRIIYERYGLSPDEEYSNSTNQTFFAIFFYSLVCYSVANA